MKHSRIPIRDEATPMTAMNILGINMKCLSFEEMYRIYDNWLAHKDSRSHSLAVINVHICVSALFDKKLRDIYNSADLTSIDSMPFLMWARVFYKKNSDRFYAPDLLLQVSSKVNEKGYTFFLYGGYPGAPEKIEEYLKQRFDGIRIVGKYSPPFRELTDREDESVCELINNAEPDFLWIGLGSPKQDIWIHEHREKLKGCIIVPSGATFDFFSGKIRQAPKFIRKIGFEWLFRLTQDFRRLWTRYTIYNVIFLIVFFFQQIGVVTFDSKGYLLLFGHRINLGNS
jgi:N-acetylglucosaminyldiphosphoundecaprenol N-acetyl-beta-D-mannosaminyltransferase